MRKPSDAPNELKDEESAREAGPQASTPEVKAWPFAPGSQLDKQVAKPWTPKPLYRFNQR